MVSVEASIAEPVLYQELDKKMTAKMLLPAQLERFLLKEIH